MACAVALVVVLFFFSFSPEPRICTAYRAVGTDKAAHVLHNAQNGDPGFLAKVGLTADIGKRHTLKWERGARRKRQRSSALPTATGRAINTHPT